MEFVQIEHLSNYMGWHEVTYKVKGVTRSMFDDDRFTTDKLIIDSFIHSSQHPFIEAYGEYTVTVAPDGVFLIHKYDTSG